ncbi:YsnF/AvaK domain-containing protein [Spirosoma fluviale]|uniref:Stress response protein YsnF n=1 Tax=Spirosoma fluviale TaxID=1597977 RepID=A0A286F969_9BACT|nr:YsnF/AvaK domain-containing protein [Spirosoma fluviale]SOD79742.1 Stress response protein YsnF [Spirosoma fluviale]
MAHTVIGVFDNATEAQKAVDELVDKGFSRSSIDLSAQTGDYSNTDLDDDDDSSVGGFFSSLFGSDDDNARRHTRVATRGSVVTVHAQSDDEAEQAADILDDNGAVDVDERASQYGYGNTDAQTTLGATGTSFGTTDTTLGTTSLDTDVTGVNYGDTTGRGLTTDRDLTTDNDQTIKVIQENLEVGKREVERGGVRVRSRIIERPVEESLRLREERVRVQRTPVNRPATEADLNAFQEGQIEMTEHSEIPVVSKTANVVEEITIGKEVNERVETIRDTVRSTDVEVENIDAPRTTDQVVTTNRTDTDYDDDLNTTSLNR